MKKLLVAATALAVFATVHAGPARAQGAAELLNASYDIGRELFIKINESFIAEWKKKTGQTVDVKQSHAGTSAQARAIIEGLPADVVTFNQFIDVQALHDKGNLVAADWQKKFPNSASPFYSLPAFLVRPGNPKNIKDWDDLIRPDVKSVFPNPKTSGNGRYTYLAAYAFALDKYKGDQGQAQEFVRKLLANVPVFDTGGRGSTTTFAERDIGDVLITFEAEVNAAKKEYSKINFQPVIPSQSLLAEFPVAVVDRNVDRKGTRALATAYLQHLYSDDAQEIIASFSNRVTNETVAARHKAEYPAVTLVTVDQVFGGWDKANQDHFGSGGILEKVFGSR